jgi:tripartite-type tricarboxylate transporter receptor subunit TctC
MKLKSRLGLVTLCAAFIAAAANPANAKYPERPVTLIIPFGPGSVSDSAARIVAQYLGQRLGEPIIVESKPGAGGLLAAQTVVRAAPDGYTLFLTTNSTHSAAPGLFKHVPYDQEKDFTPVGRVGGFPSVIVSHPDQPFKTIKEMVAYAKANPGKLSYGHGNSTGQISGEVLKQRTGIDMVRVPYVSNPQAATDLMAGHLPLMVVDFSNGVSNIKAGKMRPLAVLTLQRASALPDVPTLHETVMPNFDLIAWAGMFGPAKMPPDVVKVLSDELGKVLADPEVRRRLEATGAEVEYQSAPQFEKYLKTELVKWTSLIKASGIEPQ